MFLAGGREEKCKSLRSFVIFSPGEKLRGRLLNDKKREYDVYLKLLLKERKKKKRKNELEKKFAKFPLQDNLSNFKIFNN